MKTCNDKIKVSVIVPVYGVEKYIEKSIVSIIEQSYRNIEIVIINDETKDSSIEIAKEILSKSCVEYRIIDEKNKGLPGARNNGILNCSGNYVCFIDPDDIISSNHILNMVEFAEKSHLKVVFSDFEMTTECCREGKDVSKGTSCVYSQRELFDFFVKRKPAIHCCSLLIDRELLSDNLLFNEKLRYGEDVEFMWRLFSTIDKIGRIREKTYKYLIRSNSIMTTIGIERGEIFLREFKTTISRLSSIYPDNKDLYEIVYFRTMLGWLNSVAKTSSYELFEKCLNLVPINKMILSLKCFPDVRVRGLITILRISKKLFYQFHRIGKKN